jgi:hypothetical protein
MKDVLLPENGMCIITLGGPDCNMNGYNLAAIQMAVDLLKARNGGTVQLGEGIYEIHAPIRLAVFSKSIFK